MPHNNRITISLSNNQMRQLEALKERTGITSTAVAVRVALDAWALSLPPVTAKPLLRPSREEAIAAAQESGFDPFETVYDGRQRWELYQEPLEHYMK